MSHTAPAPAASVPPPSPPVEKIELTAGAVRLSGLLALPTGTEPRALLVALHGGGMGAGYFHGHVDPSASLLSLATAAGYAALALDRPGYGASAGLLPEGMDLADQASCVREALRGYAAEHPTGAGCFLVGHSFGGTLALTMAASAVPDDRLIGVDVSGVGGRWALPPDRLSSPGRIPDSRLHWGPLSLYPSGTFLVARKVVGPFPPREAESVRDWPRAYAGLAAAIRVPVRFTFAEHERFWACDPDAVRELTAPLTAPLVRVRHEAGAGHNISLGHAAHRHHRSVLAFLEECRARQEQETAGAGAVERETVGAGAAEPEVDEPVMAERGLVERGLAEQR
ncbi:alpha/beta hydrolase [Streptomyces sp. NPDC001606]